MVELVDAECYRLAYEFVCQLLQPSCLPRLPTDKEDHMVLPCRGFCQEFHMGCGSRIPDKLKDMLNCNTFPDYIGTGSCIPKPDLQAQALTPRVCDGVIDCVDMSDETSCSYCPAGSMHCGIGSTCISPNKRCDGSHDCPDGSDEKACLSLAPSMSALTKGSLPATPHQPEFFSKGYVMFNERGHSGKVCTERLNRTVPEPNHETTLRDIASSLCTVLHYQNVSFFRVEKDKEDNVQYVHMEDPTASEIMFVRGPCPSKLVLVVGCSNLKCGLQSLRREGGLNGLGKMAAHGDWPWHVALFKDSVHVCDGTLVSPEWLVTTASCFQG
uniref:FZ domain-containing protein n=1 Tax=Timema cristinae TaxID=61476 RepID=A0A7R9DAI1_TIMCR|nr:unnamed protein product [Timema cristinae]